MMAKRTDAAKVSRRKQQAIDAVSFRALAKFFVALEERVRSISFGLIQAESRNLRVSICVGVLAADRGLRAALRVSPSRAATPESGAARCCTAIELGHVVHVEPLLSP